MSWKTLANIIDKMPDNTYTLSLYVSYEKLMSIPSYAEYVEKNKKQAQLLQKNAGAIITFLGGERRWFIDGVFVPFRPKTQILYEKWIAGQEDGVMCGDDLEISFIVAQRFDTEKKFYLSLDILIKKAEKNKKKIGGEQELIHLADFPIPANGALDCIWDDENFDRITQPPFNWVRDDDLDNFEPYTNIYGEQLGYDPFVSFDNNGVSVTVK